MIKRFFMRERVFDPEQVARAAFAREFPHEQVAWSSVATDEADRIVVGIYYGSTIPPGIKFFAVNKQTKIAEVIEDDAIYRPKVWR